jgi:hypothetical protein
MNKETKNMDKERSFSIELNGKQTLKNVTLNNSSNENVLIEGTIGQLEFAQFVEDNILEIAGTAGVQRVNIAKNDISEVKKP